MSFLKKLRITLIPLIFYWPLIFTLTHIPIPKIIRNIPESDKVLHFFAYMLLSMLIWFAIKSDEKVNFRKAAVWWVFVIVVWYGVMDEWLQGFVGRTPDIWDFASDAAGTVCTMLLISILGFWITAFCLNVAIIVIVTNVMGANFDQYKFVMPVLNILLYGVLMFVWMACLNGRVGSLNIIKRFLLLIIIPSVVLGGVEIYLRLNTNHLQILKIVAGLVMIIIVALADMGIAYLKIKKAFAAIESQG
jgi:hypothetical protein